MHRTESKPTARPAMSASLSSVRTLAALLSFVLLAACGPDQNGDPGSESGTAKPASKTTAPASDQPTAVGVDAINEADYRRYVEVLASDEFGGRAPASPGEELTINFLTKTFQDLGLKPANNGSYTQDVPLAWVKVVNNPPLVIGVPDGDPIELGYTTDVVIGTRKQVPATAIENTELVFVGYGINAPERNWNDYAGIDVTGKTVIMLVNDPGYATQDPDLFNGNAMTYYGRWDYKFDEAARQGAAGAIIIHDTKPAAYPWSTVVNSWTGPQFDMVLPDLGAKLASVEGWITRAAAENLFSKGGLDLTAMYLRAQQPGFTAVPLGLTASASLQNETATVNSRNVAALLPGNEAPDEIFIYMAHWDHLGTDANLEGDKIYNGALDNASGTASLMVLAEAFATLPQPPRRSILFLAVTAEEQGLLGSLYYSANPLFPLENTVGGLNMDGMNDFGKTRDITVVGLGMSELDGYLAAAAAAQERVLQGDREAEKGYYYRSDHFELAKRGVPMLYATPGYDHREKGVAYGMQKAEEYTANNYHRVSDEYNLSWDVSGAVDDMNLYFKVGLDVANSTEWPNWMEGTEFKAKRDAQRPGGH